MDVQVVDALASLNAVVDDDPEPLVQLLLLRDLLRGVQEVAEELFVTLLRLAELRQAAADLGDDQKVGLCLGRDVPERQAQVILVDDVAGNLLGDDLIEDGGFAAVGHALEVRLDRGGLLVARGCHRRHRSGQSLGGFGKARRGGDGAERGVASGCGRGAADADGESGGCDASEGHLPMQRSVANLRVKSSASVPSLLISRGEWSEIRLTTGEGARTPHGTPSSCGGFE